MQIKLADGDAAIRFKNAVERLAPGVNTRILLAVSGGPDSLAMLLLAHAVMPDHIAAATVDHGLRPEAANEAAFVAGLCAERTIAHQILKPDRPIQGNLQSAARAARYALLERAADTLQCDLIATAHHSDDQLETVLMRLARGSGVSGLAGIRVRNGRIIRPLLGFAKAELEKICTDGGVNPVHDPSNNDADFDRVAMRQFLGRHPHPFDPSRAARTASALAETADALEWMTTQLGLERVTSVGGAVEISINDLPRELQRRLVIAGLQKLVPEINPRGEAIERLLDNLNTGKTAMIGDILCKGGDVCHFSPAPRRRTG